MHFLSAAWISCLLALACTQMASGTNLSPAKYDWIETQCKQPLPDEFTDCVEKVIVTSDCDCGSLMVTHPSTGVQTEYKIIVESSGAFLIQQGEQHFLLIFDQASNSVVIKPCVRLLVNNEIHIYALNDEGVVSVCYGDSKGSVNYEVVTREVVSYPTTAVGVPSNDYETIAKKVTEPLPPYFADTATKRIIEDESGNAVIECILPGTVDVYRFTLVDVPDAGLCKCLDNEQLTYVVIITKNMLPVVKRAEEIVVDSRSVLCALDDYNTPCSIVYDTEETNSVIYTPITRSTEEKNSDCGCQ